MAKMGDLENLLEVAREAAGRFRDAVAAFYSVAWQRMYETAELDAIPTDACSFIAAVARLKQAKELVFESLGTLERNVNNKLTRNAIKLFIGDVDGEK